MMRGWVAITNVIETFNSFLSFKTLITRLIILSLDKKLQKKSQNGFTFHRSQLYRGSVIT